VPIWSWLTRRLPSVVGRDKGGAEVLPLIPGMAPGDPVLVHLDAAYRWYNQNARRTMRNHFRLRTLQLLLASAIPVTQILMAGTPSRATAGGLGALIAIFQGIDTLHHYGEHYVAWRATAQDLIRERFLFSVLTGPYAKLSQAQARAALAMRVDAIEAAENHEWQTRELTTDAAEGSQPPLST